MDRRHFLAGTTGVAIAVAGCSGITGDSGGDEPSGPAAVARAFFEALIEGDVETANSYIHANASIGSVGQSNVESFQEANASVDSATVQSRNGDTATVHVTFNVEIESTTRTRTLPYELRREDGEWRLYEDVRAAQSGPPAPQVQWESTSRTNDADEVTAVTFTHGGGDTADLSTLHVQLRGTTIEPDSSGQLSAGDTLVVPFTGGGDGFQAGTPVTLKWDSSSNDDSSTLVLYELTGATAGGLGATVQVE